MRSNSVLLILAVMITAFVFIPLLVRRTWLQRKNGLGKFHKKVAVKLDEIWATLIWNLDEDHTVSAIVFAQGKTWAIDIIDFLFNDNSHCYKAWRDEFINEGRSKQYEMGD